MLECIPVGCEPLASVAISGGGGVSHGVVHTPPMQTPPIKQTPPG